MMSLKKLATIAGLTLLGTLVVTTTVFAVGGGALWTSAGHDLKNTRNQNTEARIGTQNVGALGVKWTAETGGDVSATPAVDGDAVYYPDWEGNLYKRDRETGDLIWSRTIAEYTGIAGVFARTTPAIYEDMLIFGDQGGRQFAGARVMAVDKNTGDLLWSTPVGDHPAAIVTQSATVFDGVVYVGVASLEEAFASSPAYPCCSFRGRMMALDAYTGDILWQTYTVPEGDGTSGYSGNAIWGSSPVVDTKRGAIYIATGNNYSVPDEFLECIVAAGDSEAAQFGCLEPENLFDAVLSLDMKTGAINWATVVIPFDAWTVGCLFELAPGNCPEPEGPDFDFGQAPILYTVRDGGRPVDLVGVGQKSGRFWSLNADTGEIVWSTQAGPGGVIGGMLWGSAYDGERIYTTISNIQFGPPITWEMTDGSTTTGGGWVALDPATGEILWQTANPELTGPMGAVTVANGVVYGCSMDAVGHMYAMDAATGEILWDFVSGGSCNAGAAVVNGSVYWGSGYASFGTGNNQFFAFDLP